MLKKSDVFLHLLKFTSRDKCVHVTAGRELSPPRLTKLQGLKLSRKSLMRSSNRYAYIRTSCSSCAS